MFLPLKRVSRQVRIHNTRFRGCKVLSSKRRQSMFATDHVLLLFRLFERLKHKKGKKRRKKNSPMKTYLMRASFVLSSLFVNTAFYEFRAGKQIRLFFSLFSDFASSSLSSVPIHYRGKSTEVVK